MKNIFVLLVIAALAGCGSFDTRTAGLEEETLLVIRGEQLVGLTVAIEPGFSKTITKQDLTKYKMGMAGSTDREVQNLETITLMVSSGNQRVIVSNGSATLLDRQLQFSHGQTRELRIR